MKNILTGLLLFLMSFGFVQSQDFDELSEPIVKEGKLLYKSEMASWIGTDLFMEKYPDKSRAGGYLSYTENGKNINIFFSRDEIPVVIASFSFDDDFNKNTVAIDIQDRNFTENEIKLYRLRLKTLEVVNESTDFFKHYQNSNYNLIPLSDEIGDRVYILTGPSVGGVLIIGNDYLLEFDKDEKLISKRAIHNNMIPFEFGKENGNPVTIHNHLPETGELMTATDICSLMLYGPYTSWGSHWVMSDKYVSIWDIEKQELFVMTREAFDKVVEDKEE